MSTKKARFRKRDGLRTEYALAKLRHPVRGKHYARASKGSNLVLLDPDVAAAFPSVEAVNDAPHMVVSVARAKARRPA